MNIETSSIVIHWRISCLSLSETLSNAIQFRKRLISFLLRIENFFLKERSEIKTEKHLRLDNQKHTKLVKIVEVNEIAH